MSELDSEKVEDSTEQEDIKQEETTENTTKETTEEKVEEVEEISKEDELAAKLAESQDKYLRLSAEFDNYRKRTLKERMELIKSASEKIVIELIPIVDDFERALGSMTDSKDIDSIKEGVNLVYSKISTLLTQKGVKAMDSLGEKFDSDIHEALTKIPVEKKKQKGKVVDVIEKGYTLNDKVVRFAKVVVGE